MTMQPLQCETCGRRVLVEKFSAAHTSIQWTSDATECPPVGTARDLVGSQVMRCDALNKSIDRAVARGEIRESRIDLPADSDIPRLH